MKKILRLAYGVQQVLQNYSSGPRIRTSLDILYPEFKS